MLKFVSNINWIVKTVECNEAKYKDAIIDDEEELDFKDTVLMQYTGLKDKNGKEIYEGDIVRFIPIKYDVFIQDISDDSPLLRQIKYDDNYGCLTFAYMNGETRTSGYSYCKDNLNTICEIIGNIYETPELVKEK